MAVPNQGLLAMMRSILERDEVDILSVLPPDGVVVAMADGSKWLVRATMESESVVDLRVVGPADDTD